jgi:hypothetical protein
MTPANSRQYVLPGCLNIYSLLLFFYKQDHIGNYFTLKFVFYGNITGRICCTLSPSVCSGCRRSLLQSCLTSCLLLSVQSDEWRMYYLHFSRVERNILENKNINHLLVSINFGDKRYVMLEDAGFCVYRIAIVQCHARGNIRANLRQ